MKISFRDYALPGDLKDCGYALTKALEDCRRSGAESLQIDPGVYHVYPDHLEQRTLCVTNNSHGLKRVAFSLQNMKDFVLDAQGAEFIFHGEILPVCVERCSNVTVKGLTIDYAHPLFGQGTVIQATESTLDLAIDTSIFPYVIKHRKLRFETPDWKSGHVHNFLEIDPVAKAPAYRAGDCWCDDSLDAEELEPGLVRFYWHFRRPFTVGNVVALAVEQRKCPGIFIMNSKNVCVEDTTVHQAWGMALVAQHTENIHLNRYAVCTREGSPYYVSAIADATHFVHCSGEVIIENCVLERQMDDPVNCHGIYTTIDKKVAEKTLLLRLNHPEQLGVDIYEPGDEIALLHRDTLNNLSTQHVKTCRILNVSCIEVTFEEELPDAVAEGDVVYNPSRMNTLIIRNCRMGANRARGPLVSTPKKAVLENNEFYTGGPGILIAGGDASYWFESGPVSDVTIRGNTFRNCLVGPWGPAAILILMESKKKTEGYFHRNIDIRENVFYAFDPAVVYAQSVDGLSFCDNRIEQTDLYPAYVGAKALVTAVASANVTVAGNEVHGFDGIPLVTEA